MRRSLWLFVLPIAAIGLTGVAVYHVAKQQRPLEKLPPPRMPARAPFDDTVAASGVAEAATENIAIGAALEGVVLEVYVPSSEVGQPVSKGTPLFRVDDRHLRAQLALAESKVTAADAELARLVAQPRPEELPPAEAKARSAGAEAARLLDEYQRAEQLGAQRAVSQQEVVTKRLAHERARQNQLQAEAELALLRAGAWEPDKQIARANVAQARAEAERIRAEIDRALVRSPIDGVVLQVNVRTGEQVSARPAAPLVVLGSLESLHIRAEIDESDIPRFQPGAKAVAYVRGNAEHAYELVLDRVEPMVVSKRTLTGDNTERVDTRVLQAVYVVKSSARPIYVGQQLDVFIASQTNGASAPVAALGSWPPVATTGERGPARPAHEVFGHVGSNPLD